MVVTGPIGAGGILAGPPSRENGRASHCSLHGLLAYGAGSSIIITDIRSMQLVMCLPMPPPGGSPFDPAPFVTALQWTPEGIQRDLAQEFLTVHLHLAVGDRQGRIAIWDIGSGEILTWLNLESDKGRLGIQDLCWVYGHPWLLMAIHGLSTIVLWNTSSGHPLWRCETSPEILGCIACDPFDSHQVCIVGSKGLVMSIQITGLAEMDIHVKRYQLVISEERSGNAGGVGGMRGEREQSGKDGGNQFGSMQTGASSVHTPSLLSSLGIFLRCMFSPTTRGLLYIMFPREILVFDLQFGMPLSSAGLPRGCAKLLDLITVVDGDILYCAHIDGKLSIWKRNEGKQLFSLCTMDTLMPSLGTSVPMPTVLSVLTCPPQILIQKSISGKNEESTVPLLQLKSASNHERLSTTAPVTVSNPSTTGQVVSLDGISKLKVCSETALLSISDDGKLWHWVISVELPELSRTSSHAKNVLEKISVNEIETNGIEEAKASQRKIESDATASPVFKLRLTGQLQLLSSTITTLAVPNPSLLATSAGGGNGQAAPVPLVALATQGGTVELIDAAANAITASFLVHNTSVRGVRWLGNSRLVSFSYAEIKGKGRGFINHLAVTCIRSGQSRFFRVLQKPERAPMRALRTSPSGRYLLILFREAPAEVWAMTKNPQMLRSLALPFTVMEWALPPAPKPTATPRPSLSSWRSSLFSKDPPSIAATVAAANAPPVPTTPEDASSQYPSEVAQEETGESFAFALVNGSLGVFELRGRRVRDYRPKWPSASFVSADVLVTAMAYRSPHVVMGDRSGNIRWWDVTTGLSSMFNSHRGGIRRIKFAPVVSGDPSRGRVAVLFNNHTFAIYDLDTQDPVANALVQPHLAGILVLELDWFPLRSNKNDSFFLCVAGADSSFRLLEVNKFHLVKSSSKSWPADIVLILSISSGAAVGAKSSKSQRGGLAWERSRPMPLCSSALLPVPHALALRMLLQLGVHASWFGAHGLQSQATPSGSRNGDFRQYLLETSLPVLGDNVVAELLLKSLEPYRVAGRLLDMDRVSAYGDLLNESCTARFAFAAAHFGGFDEAKFWLQLPHALSLLCSTGSARNTGDGIAPIGQIGSKVVTNNEEPIADSHVESLILGEQKQLSNKDSFSPGRFTKAPLKAVDHDQRSELVVSQKLKVCAIARERINWHEKLEEHDAIQKRVHELISIGDFEAAVTLLLATPPTSSHFFVDALRAVALASAISPALHQLSVNVVAANMSATEEPLSGTHLLCAVGRYQEACSQLQDGGFWVDAATLAATHLQGSDYTRVWQRWADHVLNHEHQLWRAMMLYVEAGALAKALAALRDAQQSDSAAMFLLACHEAKSSASSNTQVATEPKAGEVEATVPNGDYAGADLLDLPGDLQHKNEDVRAVCEYYGQYQRMLALHCSGSPPVMY